MKHILSVINEYFLIVEKAPIPKHPVSTKWAIWIIVLFGVIFVFDIFDYDPRTAGFIIAGIIPSVWSFHDKKYVEFALKNRYKNLLIYLYSMNLCCMVIATVLTTLGQWGEIDILFFATQSVFLLFWFLSIPLVLLYDLTQWAICAGIIFLLSIGYDLLLEWYTGYEGAIFLSSLLLIVGPVLIAAIVSLKISQYKIRKLFN